MSITSSRAYRLFVILILGFASGLPLALTGTALQAWLSTGDLDLTSIGFMSLVGLPYTFKFLWAPLMDSFEWELFGRRKFYLVLTQVLLGLLLFFISSVNPVTDLGLFAWIAFAIAFCSASQDIMIDAYRTDTLEPEERGLGSSLTVFGYRLGMILSGGIAFVWADQEKGMGLGWSTVYRDFGLVFLGLSVFTLLFIKGSGAARANHNLQRGRYEIFGFFAVLLVSLMAYFFNTKLLSPGLEKFVLNLIEGNISSQQGLNLDLIKKWLDLVSVILTTALAVPLAWLLAKRVGYQTLVNSVNSFLSLKSAGAFLALVVLYKLGDAFAGSLTTAFLIKGAHFALGEIGVINKIFGIWMTILGALLGGALMLRLGLYRSLMFFGILQLLSNFGFYLISELGQGAWGAWHLPAFDWVFISAKEAMSLDLLLLFAVVFENLTGGMGTSAFVAFLMGLCRKEFSATHFALLSALSAIGRVWVGPTSGVLSESLGWSWFFIFSALMALPGLWLLFKLREGVRSLDLAPAKSID